MLSKMLVRQTMIELQERDMWNVHGVEFSNQNQPPIINKASTRRNYTYYLHNVQWDRKPWDMGWNKLLQA